MIGNTNKPITQNRLCKAAAGKTDVGIVKVGHKTGRNSGYIWHTPDQSEPDFETDRKEAQNTSVTSDEWDKMYKEFQEKRLQEYMDEKDETEKSDT